MAVDATKPTDQELISALPGFIRDNRDQINANELAIGGDYSRSVDSQNVDYEFSVAELDQIYTVNSVSAVVLTLPEVTGAEAGTWIRVHKISTGSISLTPGGTDAIADGGAGAAIVNSSAEAKIAFIEIECVGAGQWLISGKLGTWA